MTVKTINTLAKMLGNAAKSIIENSEEGDVLMPDEVAELAVESIDLSLFKLQDIIMDFSVSEVKKVIRRTGAPIQYEPQMSLPTMSEFASKGIRYDGGIILYKNAVKIHLKHHIVNVSENRSQVNASADRSNTLDFNLIEKIDDNADINNAGDAMKMILDEENLFEETL